MHADMNDVILKLLNEFTRYIMLKIYITTWNTHTASTVNTDFSLGYAFNWLPAGYWTFKSLTHQMALSELRNIS